MKKIIVTALLGLSLVAAPAVAATPTTTELMTQAQTATATDATQAASLLQQAAAGAGSVTSAQAAQIAALIEQINSWAQTACGGATANVDACSSIYTSLLTLSGTPAVTGASANLYAAVLANAQDFTNSAPKDNKKVAELEGFLQLALGSPNPTNNGQRPAEPTND